MLWDVGGNWKTWRKPKKTKGEHTDGNGTQTVTLAQAWMGFPATAPLCYPVSELWNHNHKMLKCQSVLLIYLFVYSNSLTFLIIVKWPLCKGKLQMWISEKNKNVAHWSLKALLSLSGLSKPSILLLCPEGMYSTDNKCMMYYYGRSGRSWQRKQCLQWSMDFICHQSLYIVPVKSLDAPSHNKFGTYVELHGKQNVFKKN